MMVFQMSSCQDLVGNIIMSWVPPFQDKKTISQTASAIRDLKTSSATCVIGSIAPAGKNGFVSQTSPTLYPPDINLLAQITHPLFSHTCQNSYPFKSMALLIFHKTNCNSNTISILREQLK